MKNKFDVVCFVGNNHSLIRTIEAETEKEARDIMWMSYMDDNQRKNCLDIEIFPVSNNQSEVSN